MTGTAAAKTGGPPLPRPHGWIFSPGLDVLAFIGPFLFTLVVCAGFLAAGIPLTGVAPAWIYVFAIISMDRPHALSTVFRTYLDAEEFRARRAVYLLVPCFLLVGGILLHQASPLGFWRSMTYFTAFHIARQQWGWMAYSARKAAPRLPAPGEESRHGNSPHAGDGTSFDRRLDAVAITNAMVAPLLWLMAEGRSFGWYTDGDLVPLPRGLGPWILGVHWILNGAYLARQAQLLRRGEFVNAAKLVIWFGTWITTYVGIVVAGSELFLILGLPVLHAFPYMLAVYRHEAARLSEGNGMVRAFLLKWKAAGFYGLLVAASVLWDGLWYSYAFPRFGFEEGLFRGSVGPGSGAPLVSLIVVLLCLPTLMHNTFDMFLWKTRSNATLRRRMGLESAGGAVQPGKAPSYDSET